MVRSSCGNLVRLAGLIVLMATAAGCGSPFEENDSGGTIAEEHQLGGPQGTVQLSVGSKDFAGQEVLGHIAIRALEAAGADVEDQTGLGGTEATRRALVSGEISGVLHALNDREREPLPQ